MTNDLFGRTSHKKFFETSFPIGPQNDQINTPSAGYLNDTFMRFAYRGQCLCRHILLLRQADNFIYRNVFATSLSASKPITDTAITLLPLRLAIPIASEAAAVLWVDPSVAILQIFLNPISAAFGTMRTLQGE